MERREKKRKETMLLVQNDYCQSATTAKNSLFGGHLWPLKELMQTPKAWYDVEKELSKICSFKLDSSKATISFTRYWDQK
eukprot:scaffold16710_cov61-Attheya_sp.AAC.8